MEEEVIRPLSSEPSLAPVDSRSVVATRGDVVMRAFEEHSGKLTSFAFGMTRDRDVAEDLVQEAFLRLVKELAADRTPDNIPAWLYRVCANLATSRGRRISVAQRFIRGIHSVPDEAPADVETLRREANATLLAGLATVPSDARAALLMASQGFSGREIAEAIGRSEMATRTMMFRAREKLRVYLATEEVRS
jgi:RNA polymerase sigma-70 factor (ECF subfamily)